MGVHVLTVLTASVELSIGLRIVGRGALLIVLYVNSIFINLWVIIDPVNQFPNPVTKS
jgi:hypothetical protein